LLLSPVSLASGVLGLDDPTELGLDGIPPAPTELLGLCANVALPVLVWEAYDTSAPSGVSNSAVWMDGGESSCERYVCRVGRTSILLVHSGEHRTFFSPSTETSDKANIEIT
jgi:hypothetical protein